MDASKITELRQKQITNYIHTKTPTDASVLTWCKQTCASRFMADTVKRNPNNVANLCTTPTNYNQVIGCTNCSAEANITMQTNGIGRQNYIRPNPTLGSGSATNVYSSDKVLYYHAGNANANLSFNTSSNAYISTHSCYCSNTNISSFNEGTGIFVPPPENNGFNPYLPLPKVVAPVKCGTTVTIGSGPQVPVGCVPERKIVTLCSSGSISINPSTSNTVFIVDCPTIPN